MRLALVSQEYPPETAYGGIGTQNYAKAHGLAALGHDIHVISHSAGNEEQNYWDGPVRVTRIPGADRDLPLATDEARWITYSALVAAAIARIHASEPFDLVEFADWGSEGYVHLLNQTDWNHVPSVIHLHGPIVMFAHAIGWPEVDSEFYRVARMMEETSLRRADAVYSSSRCSAEWCERFHGLDGLRVPVIHTGVDTSHFCPRDLPKDHRPTILFVGKIERNKGVLLLAEAAIRLAREIPNLRLRLVGRGDERLLAELRRRADAVHPDLIETTGYVEHARLPEHLSRAHVFAAPSEYEGGPGFVYLEAMACGLPVVACSGSGAAEVVTPGETGFLIPPRDEHALVESLRRLLRDRELREAMGQNAVDYVRREADRSICLRRLEKFYAAAAGIPLRCEATT